MSLQKIVYIDTDIALGTPGAEIDDAAALMLLLANPGVHIAGIGSVFGNAPIESVATNLARFLGFLDIENVPLGFGAEHPLFGSLNWFDIWQSGYGKTPAYPGCLPSISSSDLLVDCVHKFPGQVSILALGPMTNIAEALEKSPGIAPQVKEVIAMGGSFDKEPTDAEFNIHCDPTAADRVIHAGWPVTLLGLDVTRQAVFSKDQFTAVSSQHPAVYLLKSQASGWIDRVIGMGWEKDGCALHDAVAAAYLLDSTLFRSVPAQVAVSTEPGENWGRTHITESTNTSEKIRVVKEMDSAHCRDLIWSAITKDWEKK